jgi:hypothetical protein
MTVQHLALWNQFNVKLFYYYMGSHQKLKRNEMKVSPISFLPFKNQKYCKFIIVVSDMYIVIDLLLFNSSISAIFKQTINHVGER